LSANARVLVVEDDEAVRFLTRLALTAAGWIVSEAATAADCRQMISEVDPDVVLLDLGLPDVDGVAVLSELKGEESTSWVPVVILSGRSDRSEVSRLLLAGAQDYVMKPFTPDELHARLVAARRSSGWRSSAGEVETDATSAFRGIRRLGSPAGGASMVFGSFLQPGRSCERKKVSVQ
jgi:DNA-binding response OmpR family regulator